jgi:hypothetical protein
VPRAAALPPNTPRPTKNSMRVRNAGLPAARRGRGRRRRRWSGRLTGAWSASLCRTGRRRSRTRSLLVPCVSVCGMISVPSALVRCRSSGCRCRSAAAPGIGRRPGDRPAQRLGQPADRLDVDVDPAHGGQDLRPDHVVHVQRAVVRPRGRARARSARRGSRRTRGCRPPLPTTGRPFVAGGEDLRAGEALLQAVEAVGVDGGVAVDERVLELVARGLDLELVLDRALVVDVAARLPMNVSTSASPPRMTSVSVFWLTVPVDSE